MIRIDGLVKRYGDTVAVDHLGFSARPGRVTALLGPNGAGKTTTLRVLLGLAHPTAGSALIEDRPYAELEHPVQAVGAVVEESTYHPGRSARTHLEVLARAAGLPLRRTPEVLDVVGLADVADQRVGTYSLGMRQRLGLAAALLGEPGTLVLDEPQNGLDPQGSKWLRGMLRELAAAGRTVLVSSHLLAEVTDLADDVVIVSHGRLVRQAPLTELLQDSGQVRVGSADPEQLARVITSAGLVVDRADGGQLLVRGRPASEIAALATSHGIAVHELVTERRRLEDIFMELTDDSDAPARKVAAR
jgi:ABC-2 type transport system ATP-binding protein